MPRAEEQHGRGYAGCAAERGYDWKTPKAVDGASERLAPEAKLVVLQENDEVVERPGEEEATDGEGEGVRDGNGFRSEDARRIPSRSLAVQVCLLYFSS